MFSRAQRALRISCLLYFVLVAANYVAAALEQEKFPTAPQMAPTASPIYAAGSSLALLGVLIATLGLLAKKRWAAYGHVASTALMVAFCFPGEVVLAGGPRALVSTAIYVLTGIIYGLAFFTDALVAPED